ncbi:C40 family peptidase [bacterium]|nr:C40 family peptidase [bacterium]MCB2202013.1 C40 family peptidase [bacterium]
MTYGYVSANILDLRAKPDMHAERLHQVLFGSPVTIVRKSGAYRFITDPIGYQGWAHEGGLVEIDGTSFRSARRGKLVVIRSPQARLYASNRSTPIDPFVLFYGTILEVARSASDRIILRLPDDRRFAIKRAQIAPMNGRKSGSPTGADLVGEAKRFLGIPYLWGGVSTPGFDCSGLVHTICARFGMALPRDTKDQIRVGTAVERNAVRTGDLVFFDRHVGFAIGRDRIIHASVAGQGVRINSLTTGSPDYREDLDRSYKEARRIL